MNDLDKAIEEFERESENKIIVDDEELQNFLIAIGIPYKIVTFH